MQIVHFYWLLQLDVISKRENTLGILADKLIRWQDYPSWFFSPNSGEVQSLERNILSGPVHFYLR